ncbi:MAG TPA: hypothetical protein VJP81_10830 [Candidatus Dormibacteraeota bacterium]|nr:hypothetical protein [Candidatus Dormibacteraeota bacterium]
MRRLIRLAVVAVVMAAQSFIPITATAKHEAAPPANCQLNNGIKHVVSIVFDNTHLSRDRANVASDLEQMPNLLNFLTDNGTVSDNEHTILISHTAGGILTSLTGLYPDRMGITVSNSYRYFTPTKATAGSGAFKYWTDLVDDTNGTLDPLPNMVTTGQKTTPAPWVPYTRAGCDFGAVATANVVLENTGTGAFGDITEVFGKPSAQWTDADQSNHAPSGTAARAKAQTDFVGLAIHCAPNAGICKGNSDARPDVLFDEPGGYAGFQGLFGAKYVNPAITPGHKKVVQDTAGGDITDPFSQPGFPGFDGMFAKVTLGYVAQMQEAGVPITFGYISDAHDNHNLTPPRASGPGEADYMQQLHDYDTAFGVFFKRLANDGINKSNTLFVFTSDEGDHFAGGTSSDGTWNHNFCDASVTPPVTCAPNQIGEVTQNLNALLPPLAPGQTRPTFSAHFDSAPTIYVSGQPDRTDSNLRQLERDLAAGQAVDPYLSSSPSPVMLWMADPVGEEALHMVNADPRRTPSFTYFAVPDYFLTTSNPSCPDAAHRVPTCVDFHFAWSHGDVTDDIGRTWLGFVGPGVKNLGRTSKTWSDHADIRPTILALLGLTDSYEPDGAVLADFLQTSAVSSGLRKHHASLVELHEVYKQISAPFGPFAHNTLVASTHAINSGSSADDSHYTTVENGVASLTAQRDALEAQMRTALTDAAFGSPSASEHDLKDMIDRGLALLEKASALAAGS